MVSIHTEGADTTTESQDADDIITKRHKRWQIMKMSVIALLAVLCIVFLLVDLAITANIVKEQQELKDYIQASSEVASVIVTLQDERSLSVFHLAAILWNINIQSEYNVKLQNVRNITDAKIQDLRHKWEFRLSRNNGNVIADFASFVDAINILRSKMNDETDERRLRYYFEVYSKWIHELMSYFANNPTTHDHTDHASDLAACHMIVKCREEFEMEKVLGALYFYYGRNFSYENVSSYNEKRVRAKAFLDTAQALSSSVQSNYVFLKSEMNASLCKLEPKRQILKSNSLGKSSSKNDSVEWFKLMTSYTKLLLRLEVAESRRIAHHIKTTVNRTTVWLILRSLLVCLVLILVPFFITSLVRVQNEVYKYAHTLHHKVGLEQSRTEFLLRENSRHMEGLAVRWKRFSQQPNPDKDFAVQPRPGVPNSEVM